MFDEQRWLWFGGGVQRKEWMLRAKAQEARRLNRLVLDDIFVIDCGDGKTVKSPPLTLDVIKWYHNAIKWVPPGASEGLYRRARGESDQPHHRVYRR